MKRALSADVPKVVVYVGVPVFCSPAADVSRALEGRVCADVPRRHFQVPSNEHAMDQGESFSFFLS